MKRGASLFVLLLWLAAGSESCAQGTPGGSTNMNARDSTRTGMRFVYLIRHAIYDYQDPRDERIGKGLDSLGRVQAKLTGERLASLPFKVDQLVSSTFTRAAQTADVIGESLHLRPTRDSMLSECTAPSNRADYMRNLEPGEADTCSVRIARAYERYLRPAGGREERHDVLVSHGNVIRVMVGRALGMDPLRWPELSIGNCSITALQVMPDGRIILAAFSDTGHLPPAAQTWTGRGAGWSPAPPPRRSAATSGTRTNPAGVAIPAPAAAFDTLRHSRPTNR